MTDFHFADHGSVTILTAITQAARHWVTDHLPPDAQSWGTNGVVIERRYAGDILQGITDDGLTWAS